jgi:hypothetical protein
MWEGSFGRRGGSHDEGDGTFPSDSSSSEGRLRRCLERGREGEGVEEVATWVRGDGGGHGDGGMASWWVREEVGYLGCGGGRQLR